MRINKPLPERRPDRVVDCSSPCLTKRKIEALSRLSNSPRPVKQGGALKDGEEVHESFTSETEKKTCCKDVEIVLQFTAPRNILEVIVQENVSDVANK